MKTPPTAPGLPVLGNAVDLVRDPLAFFARMYEEMGPVFRAGGFGRYYTILAGPEANRRFLEWEDRFMSSGPVYQPYVEDIGTRRVLIAMDGEPHRAYRKWLRPGFSRESIAPRVPQLVDAVQAILSTWKTGDILDVTDVMQFLISQVSGLALAGCPVGHHFDDARVFGHTFLGAGVGSFPGFMRNLPRYRRARRRFLDFLKGVVADHRGDDLTGRSPDLIDLLLRGSTDLGEPVTEADLLASAHMPYTNSLVYVAATCGFMLYELLKHSDVLDRVQAEVDDLYADGPPDLSRLRHGRWLRGALLETQRMHPISLSVPRFVQTSFEFEGYLIEEGAMTLTATAVTHFMPEFFPEPHRFDVSRYWAPRREHRQRGMLVPYGLGPHACLSAGVVDTLILLNMATLLRHAEFALEPPEYELGLSVAPFPAPARNFKVRFTGRRASAGVRAEPVQSAPLDLAEILPDLDTGSLVRAAYRAERRTFQPEEEIIREGAPADALYIITAGTVDVVKEDQQGQPKVVAQLGAGEYFGEIGLLHDVPRTATVRAATTVETIVLDREAFRSLVAETDMTSGEIAEEMRRRLVTTTLATSLPGLTPDQVARLSPRFELTAVEPGALIIRQGDPADRFYIIVSGQVDVVNEHPDGRDIPLGVLGEGEYFGEIGLLQNRPRNATVRADAGSGVMVMALNREDFLAMMTDSDATGDQVALRMAERLTDLIHARTNPQ